VTSERKSASLDTDAVGEASRDGNVVVARVAGTVVALERRVLAPSELHVTTTRRHARATAPQIGAIHLMRDRDVRLFAILYRPFAFKS
jgi:hypothetical protein